MYLNSYQEYIKILIAEYGTLLIRQLLQMINFKFDKEKESIDGYVSQMCRFDDYELVMVGNEKAMCRKGDVPDYDIIRSFDVMLAFIPRIQHHRKSRDFISIVFIISSKDHEKEIFVIPVKSGNEKIISDYADDKFTAEKCEVVIFLLDNKEQLKFIQTECNHKFAVLEKDGVKFLKHNI